MEWIVLIGTQYFGLHISVNEVLEPIHVGLGAVKSAVGGFPTQHTPPQHTTDTPDT